MTKYDWETIKNNYIYGIRQEDNSKHFPTYKELCAHYGCALGTLGTRAKKEEWQLEREKVKDKIEKKVAEKRTQFEAETIVRINEEYSKGADIARGTAIKKLKQLNEDMDNPDPKAYVRAYDIKMATDALSIAQGVSLTANEEIKGRFKLDSDIEGNLNILDDKFCEKELTVLKELIKK